VNVLAPRIIVQVNEGEEEVRVTRAAANRDGALQPRSGRQLITASCQCCPDNGRPDPGGRNEYVYDDAQRPTGAPPDLRSFHGWIAPGHRTNPAALRLRITEP